MDIQQCRLIADAVRASLARVRMTDAEVESLRQSVRTNALTDYEQDAHRFAAAYWERNFWKAAYFFGYEYRRPSVMSRLLDAGPTVHAVVLGAGSAADAVACLAWLDSEYPLQAVTVTLVDQSRQQLELARGIIGIACGFLQRAVFDIRYEQRRAGEWSLEPDSADLVLMSHFLTENRSEKEALVASVIAALKPRGDLIIIERERDPIWRDVRDRLALNGVTTHDVKPATEKFDLLAPALPDAHADMTPAYVRGQVPENKRLMELVRDYFQAWLGQSSDGLSGIFTPQAVYDEKPGIEPRITGLDAIRRYWDMHPGRQRDILLRVHAVTYSDTVSVCSFSGAFDTPKQHIAIQGAMNFYLDPYAGKIHRFAEYFGTVKTPLR